MDAKKVRQSKLCGKCGEVKALDGFYQRGDGQSGGRSACKMCYRRTNEQRKKRVLDHACSSESATRLSMIQRCHNPNNPGYKNYGGRGIKVCERWRESTEAFIEDMGRRPSSEHTVERIDNDGDYEPSNCKWLLRTEQARNTRQNVLITIDGVTMCASEWARVHGVDADAIRSRILKGCDPISAATTPVRECVFYEDRMIKALGVTRSLAEWSSVSGINGALIKSRIRIGWTPDRAVTQPVRSHLRRHAS